MTDKPELIAKAAVEVISRYGLRKTTMADVARAAGVSRQTLYNVFPAKDDVVRGAILYLTGQSTQAVRTAWEQHHTLSAKLDSFFELGPLAWYDLIAAAPDAADLIEGLHTTGAAVMAEAMDGWVSDLAAELRPFVDAVPTAGTSPEALADYIMNSSAYAKMHATSRAQVEARLAMLKASVLALLGTA